MARIGMLVMVVVVGLWVVGQAINTKKIVEEHHAILMNVVEAAKR